MSYKAPVDEMYFALETATDSAELAVLPGFEAAVPDLVERSSTRLRNSRKTQSRRSTSREIGPVPFTKQHRTHAVGLPRSLFALRCGWLERALFRPGIWRTGIAAGAFDRRFGNMEFGLCELCPVSAPDRRCRRTLAGPRFRGGETALAGTARRRRMDRRNEPDRATGRLRSRVGALPRRASPRSALGRALTNQRAEDLHHLCGKRRFRDARRRDSLPRRHRQGDGGGWLVPLSRALRRRLRRLAPRR